jgi:hypothetical protein
MGMASDFGAGAYFVILVLSSLTFFIFLFPVRTAQFIGEFRKNY